MNQSRRRFLAASAAVALTSSWLRAEDSPMAAGTKAFFAGNPDEALRHWDRQIAADPASGPHHWQRGIALYYAGKFKEGRAQFESHQTVNPQDVENAVWHFLCVARLESVAAARKVFIPVTGDPRVPMKEIHALFAGSSTAEAVLTAAKKQTGQTGAESLKNQQCYAHLYLGLYHEALGEADQAQTHLVKAAGEFRMDHYMGKVAQVHCQVRGWKVRLDPG